MARTDAYAFPEWRCRQYFRTPLYLGAEEVPVEVWGDVAPSSDWPVAGLRVRRLTGEDVALSTLTYRQRLGLEAHLLQMAEGRPAQCGPVRLTVVRHQAGAGEAPVLHTEVRGEVTVVDGVPHVTLVGASGDLVASLAQLPAEEKERAAESMVEEWGALAGEAQ